MAKESSAFLFMQRSIKIFIIFILLILLLVLFPIDVLEVRADRTEKLVYQQLANIGDTFDVRWVHSVTLQPVIETYRLEAPDRIPIIQMVFDDNGPNLPAHPEYNQKWIIKDGKFIVTNYDRIFERVPVTIGAVIADHTLVYNGKSTPLKEEFRPGGYVHIGLIKDTPAQYLVKEVQLWLKKQKTRPY
ncbi:MAG: DUF1850 domain-containing protein [Bacillota bacterium]